MLLLRALKICICFKQFCLTFNKILSTNWKDCIKKKKKKRKRNTSMNELLPPFGLDVHSVILPISLQVASLAAICFFWVRLCFEHLTPFLGSLTTKTVHFLWEILSTACWLFSGNSWGHYSNNLQKKTTTQLLVHSLYYIYGVVVSQQQFYFKSQHPHNTRQKGL